MSQNLLFILEFDVLELVINQWDECAPHEYPLNAEFSFRSNLYVSIPEEDFGSVKDESGRKTPHVKCRKRNDQNKKDNSGQGCIFAMEKSVEEDECLIIRVYKKRSEKCKFLIGSTDYKMKEMFDKVIARYTESNSNARNYGNMNDEKNNQLHNSRHSAGEQGRTSFSTGSLSPSSGRPSNERNDSRETTFHTAANTTKAGNLTKTEQPASEIHKMSFPLYNSEAANVGNIVVLIRLSCMGSKVCSSTVYPVKSQKISTKQLVCAAGSQECIDTCPAKVDPCPRDVNDDICLGESICSDGAEEESSCSPKSSLCSEIKSKPTTIRPRVDDAAYDEFEANLNGCGLAIRVMKNSHKVTAVRRLEHSSMTRAVPDASRKLDFKRLFALICNGLQSVPPEEQNTSFQASSENSFNVQKLCECVVRMMQCDDGNNELPGVSSRSKDELHLTRLNSGKIGKKRAKDNDRQLSTHSYQSSGNVNSLTKKILELCVKYCSNRDIDITKALEGILCDNSAELSPICQNLGQYLKNDRNVLCDHLRKETTGRVYNAPGLPKIHGNIKYPTSTNYGTADFTLPLPEDCAEDGVEQYRRKDANRECCVQIDGTDIDNTMRGVKKKLPHGIEICRKGTMDLDSDVFVLKMGKKTALADKQGLVEIELRTPKGPNVSRVQHASVFSQVDEEMLKERVNLEGNTPNKAGGNKKKGKGKGGKKGKKGKK